MSKNREGLRHSISQLEQLLSPLATGRSQLELRSQLLQKNSFSLNYRGLEEERTAIVSRSACRARSSSWTLAYYSLSISSGDRPLKYLFTHLLLVKSNVFSWETEQWATPGQQYCGCLQSVDGVCVVQSSKHTGTNQDTATSRVGQVPTQPNLCLFPCSARTVNSYSQST